MLTTHTIRMTTDTLSLRSGRQHINTLTATASQPILAIGLQQQCHPDAFDQGCPGYRYSGHAVFLYAHRLAVGTADDLLRDVHLFPLHFAADRISVCAVQALPNPNADICTFRSPGIGNGSGAVALSGINCEV